MGHEENKPYRQKIWLTRFHRLSLSGLIWAMLCVHSAFIFLSSSSSLSSSLSAGEADLVEITLNEARALGDDWHLSLSLPYFVLYSVFTLDNPHRLVIDILDERFKPQPCQVKIKPVMRCRVGRLNGARARFVLDLKQAFIINHIELVKKNKDFQLDIRIGSATDGKMDSAEKPPLGFALGAGVKQRTQKVIMIDPGHGGDDLGSRFGRLKEKNIVLLYGLELKKQLEERGYRVYLTRLKDERILLRDRLLMARYLRADMVISLHTDWNADSKVRGFAVYSLSNRSAGQYARAFLEDENAQMIGGEDWQKELPMAKNILFDLTQRENIESSLQLSRHILRQVRDLTPLLDQPHRFAGFHMLSAPDLPSILIELGFLSNETDIKKLISKSWRKRLIGSMIKGIDNYFAQKTADSS